MLGLESTSRRRLATFRGIEPGESQPHGRHPQKGRPGNMESDEHFGNAVKVLRVADAPLQDCYEQP